MPGEEQGGSLGLDFFGELSEEMSGGDDGGGFESNQQCRRREQQDAKEEEEEEMDQWKLASSARRLKGGSKLSPCV